MSIHLDSRVIRIARWLLEQNEPHSTADLAADLGLSQRVVRYRLPNVSSYLEEHGASLQRVRGVGLIVDGSPALRAQLIEDLTGRSEAPRVYSPDERSHMIIAALLWSAPQVTSLDVIHDELEVSKTSARRDLRLCEPWLERNGLPLIRRPGQGLVVAGTERRIRQVMVQLILETIPSSVLDAYLGEDDRLREQQQARVPVGLRERLQELPLTESASIVRSSPLGRRLADSRAATVFSVYLAVTVARIGAGRMVDVEAGLQRSVLDHPVAPSVEALRPAVEELLGSPLLDSERGAITEYLLGLDALNTVSATGGAIDDQLLDRLLAEAADRLHPVLADDVELRRGVKSHLERLVVRLRHGLPVHNPLLAEVRERYPDVHDVAGRLGQVLEEHIGAPVADDEVGFITMYLSGAMERARLRPRRRALVVCPSGMATAWVLVSRIQAEFPEFDLVEVLSESGYEDLDHRNYDLVISTVPVAEHDAPVVVVSPLLSAGDVSRVNAAAG